MKQISSRRAFAAVIIGCVLLAILALWLWPQVRTVRPAESAAQSIPPGESVQQPDATPPLIMVPPPGKTGTTTELAFLGNVEADISTELVNFQTDSGAKSLPFNVYRRKDGVFLRAVYHQEGTPTFEEPAWKIQRIMKTRDETITDLPPSPPAARWQDLVTKFGRDLDEDMSGATEIVISYVNYKRPHKWVGKDLTYQTSAVFLVHVYGAATIMEDFPDTPQNRRVRGVYTADGEAVNFDNVL